MIEIDMFVIVRDWVTWNCIVNVVCVERKMNENNVIELWIMGIEYVVIMVVYEYLVYKVSLGYVALALVYCCPADMWLYGQC
jgi:hypothetical protein